MHIQLEEAKIEGFSGVQGSDQDYPYPYYSKDNECH